MIIRKGKRCFLRKLTEDKDYDFIGLLQENDEFRGMIKDVDYIGWSINGDATEPVGVSYTIEANHLDQYIVIGVCLNEYFQKKLYKQLKRNDIYTFVEDFIKTITDEYKESHINKKIIIEIPYKSSTMKLLYKKNGYTPTHTVMIKE